MDHILSELPTMTCPSCLAHNGMVHSFIELFKTLHHKAVIHEGVKISYFCDFNGFGSDVKTMWEIPSKSTIPIHEFIFWGSKINADDDCSHEIKRQLLLGRKAMTNLDSILKSRDITLPTKVCLVRAMVFPAVMYGCESWTIKKTELWRIDAFELWCWRRLLRVAWTAGKSNQSFLKEISSESSLEGLKLKLKLQYFGHLMWRTDSLEKTLMLGKIKGRRRRGWQRRRWLGGNSDSMDMSLSRLQELVMDRCSWWWTDGWHATVHGLQRVGDNWATELNWIHEHNIISVYIRVFNAFQLC